MSAPVSDIKKLIFSADGSPYAKISVTSANNLTFSLDGSPWWGNYESGTPPATTWKIYVGSTQVSAIYIGSTEVTQLYVGTTALKT